MSGIFRRGAGSVIGRAYHARAAGVHGPHVLWYTATSCSPFNIIFCCRLSYWVYFWSTCDWGWQPLPVVQIGAAANGTAVISHSWHGLYPFGLLRAICWGFNTQQQQLGAATKSDGQKAGSQPACYITGAALHLYHACCPFFGGFAICHPQRAATG